MRIAVVHDWLVTYAGAERVLEQVLHCFPSADIFCVVDSLRDDQRGFILGKPATTTFVQRLPFARTRYRAYLPFMPFAIEQLDLSAYDLILSSSHAVAKGVITGPDQLHLCLCYSPIRYAWDLQHRYLKESGLDRGVRGWIARFLLHRIRTWDVRSSNGIDDFIAISSFIARRIRKTYRRESTVIYPPVDMEFFTPGGSREDFYLTVSRLVPYKRADLIAEAFGTMPNARLVVIGDGPDLRKVRQKAGPNVTVLGHQSVETVRDYLRRCRAFVFAAEEDFGIAPLEAQACGAPVIAYGRGGVRETVVPRDAGVTDVAVAMPTGVFFMEQSVEAIAAAVGYFEGVSGEITSAACRLNAARFGVERFRAEFRGYVENRWQAFQASITAAPAGYSASRHTGTKEAIDR